MKTMLLMGGIGLLLGIANVGRAQELPVLQAFPAPGVEYILRPAHRFLPGHVECDAAPVLVLERADAAWVLVSFLYPKRYSFSPTRVGVAWINLEGIDSLEVVADRDRVVPDPRR